TPALLLSFDGQMENECAQLTWVMENETNCKWFVIERAGETGGYDSIDVVAGLNNKNQTTYSFEDGHMVIGNNYYRLRQVDRDGNVRYSKVVTLYKNAPAAKGNSMGIYPNPATSTISYTVASTASTQVIVQVYNMSGVVLLTTQQQLNAGNNQQTVALSGLKNGNYFLRVTNREGSCQYVQPFVKIM
ncbi:MAG TPA: T9SS type A sorting domain-containing protein, partial [Puia sp.]|nr:T9SS type A sorting domain-containing protein [Puia sp.]